MRNCRSTRSCLGGSGRRFDHLEVIADSYANSLPMLSHVTTSVTHRKPWRSYFQIQIFPWENVWITSSRISFKKIQRTFRSKDTGHDVTLINSCQCSSSIDTARLLFHLRPLNWFRKLTGRFSGIGQLNRFQSRPLRLAQWLTDGQKRALKVATYS